MCIKSSYYATTTRRDIKKNYNKATEIIALLIILKILGRKNSLKITVKLKSKYCEAMHNT